MQLKMLTGETTTTTPEPKISTTLAGKVKEPTEG